MGDTALSGVVGVGVWVILITSKVNTNVFVQFTTNVFIKLSVKKCAEKQVRLIKTFHTLRTGFLTFAHRDDQGLVRKILSCCLTSKKQQVTNFNHQL